MNALHKKVDIKSVLIGRVPRGGYYLSIAAATNRGRTVWEYKVVTGNVFREQLGKAINNGVADGWEFVSASGPNNENWGIAVLKREKK